MMNHEKLKSVMTHYSSGFINHITSTTLTAAVNNRSASDAIKDLLLKPNSLEESLQRMTNEFQLLIEYEQHVWI